MSTPRIPKGHWKELVASAREKHTEPVDQGTAGQPAGTPLPGPVPSRRWSTARRLYQEYFTRFRYVWLGASLLILAASLGLAFAPDGRPSRVHVSGQVLLDDKPLTNSTIMFIPREGRSAAATVDEQGRFTLSCFSGEDGAIPGDYRLELSMTKAPKKGEAPWPVPRIYTSHLTSGLTAEITKSTSDLTIRLTSPPEESADPPGGDTPPLRPDSR